MITIKKFSKPGCRPCTILANYLTEVDFDAHGATLENIDISQQPGAIDRYKLTSVPVLVFERNGVEVARLNGLVNPQEIIDTIEHAKQV
jgi:thioredoxin 1